MTSGAADLDRRRQALASEIAAIAEEGALLPGTLLVRWMGCGKPGCRCKADPPQLHGPYIQWTRKVAGKTVTRRLTQEELGRYQAWFDNARQLRDLVGQLEALCLQAASAAEGWPNPEGS
ncbi:MAG TPA: DUF6788 family protein [Actinomycetota bacterium]|nr:DUF6788 family protein [Actinomycetota bacterium]